MAATTLAPCSGCGGERFVAERVQAGPLRPVRGAHDLCIVAGGLARPVSATVCAGCGRVELSIEGADVLHGASRLRDGRKSSRR